MAELITANKIMFEGTPYSTENEWHFVNYILLNYVYCVQQIRQCVLVKINVHKTLLYFSCNLALLFLYNFVTHTILCK